MIGRGGGAANGGRRGDIGDGRLGCCSRAVPWPALSLMEMEMRERAVVGVGVGAGDLEAAGDRLDRAGRAVAIAPVDGGGEVAAAAIGLLVVKVATTPETAVPSEPERFLPDGGQRGLQNRERAAGDRDVVVAQPTCGIGKRGGNGIGPHGRGAGGGCGDSGSDIVAVHEASDCAGEDADWLGRKRASRCRR